MLGWILAAGGPAGGPLGEMQVTSEALGLLGFYVGGALAISFLCSILEAALLSVRVTELLERKAAGEAGATALLALKEERVDDAISAILTLNTIAHTIGATLAGAQFAAITGNRWLGIFSGVLTLLVLVVTEIIPKTLGTVYASQLVGFVARTLKLLMFLLAPILLVTRAITGLISHGGGSAVSRGELAALVALASQDGTLRHQESRVLANVLRFDSVRVVDVMTPRTVAAMLPARATLAELLADEGAHVFSRMPLFGETRDDVRGYVLVRDGLRAALAGAPPETPLDDYRRDLWALPGSASLAEALRQFLQRPREHMALVVDEFGGVSGIVTMEDVVETILGVEILDESDQVADLRKVALDLRDRRLERTRTRRLGGERALAGPDRKAGRRSG